MELKDRIIKYILNNPNTTMDTIIGEATSKGYTQHEVLTALDSVHKDKRITHTANASGVVVYRPAKAKVSTVPTHVTYWHDNYPPMTTDNDGSGIDIDLSWMFLKTKDERDDYKAAAKGLPKHMMNTYAR